MGRDHRTGLPNKLIPCPLGARKTSDSCRKSRCEYVSIPIRGQTQNLGDDYKENIWIQWLLILIFLKLFVIFCGACYSFCFPVKKVSVCI